MSFADGVVQGVVRRCCLGSGRVDLSPGRVQALNEFQDLVARRALGSGQTGDCEIAVPPASECIRALITISNGRPGSDPHIVLDDLPLRQGFEGVERIVIFSNQGALIGDGFVDARSRFLDCCVEKLWIGSARRISTRRPLPFRLPLLAFGLLCFPASPRSPPSSLSRERRESIMREVQGGFRPRLRKCSAKSRTHPSK